MLRDMINGMFCMKMVSYSSSIGTATRLWVGQLRNMAQFLAQVGAVSLLYGVQTAPTLLFSGY
jgi:hypothetical protein